MNAKRFGTIALALVLLVSCGSNDDGERVLHLPGQNLTEAELRDLWRSQIDQAPAAGAVICDDIIGAQPEEVLDYFEYSVSPTEPEQTNWDDIRRAAEIIEEECSRRFGRL